MMNQNSIIDFTRKFNKNFVSLYCRKCDFDFACKDEYELNPDKLSSQAITDGHKLFCTCKFY